MSKHKVYISNETPIAVKDWPAYISSKQMSERIFNIFGISIWIGNLSFIVRRVLPKFSYFNGGTYWKFSFYWLKFIVEFSGGKKNKALYKEITSKDLNKILKQLNYEKEK